MRMMRPLLLAGGTALLATNCAVGAELGWAKLEAKQVGDVRELLKYPDTSRTFDETVKMQGPRLKARFLKGPATGEYQDGLFVGTLCEPRNCNVAGMIVIADPVTRKMYVGFRTGDEPGGGFSEARADHRVNAPKPIEARIFAWYKTFDDH
jgi:hypothetical protein